MKSKRQALAAPMSVYHACPACKDTELIRLQADVLCSKCDWMSVESFVAVGGMDNLYSAFRDHFLSQGRMKTTIEAESESMPNLNCELSA